MRSLFLRIFLSFWGATALLGGLLVVLSLTSDPRRADFGPHEGDLREFGAAAVAAHRTGGSPALRDLERLRASRGQPPVFLFQGGGGPLSGAPAPPLAGRLAARAAATGEPEVRRGRRGLWLAAPIGGDYVVVAQVPPPTRLERLFNPHLLTLRLSAAFLVTGLVSYLLARSLSAPVRRLRAATQALAAGDLSARVGAPADPPGDEVAELGRDFDRMAAHIEALVAAQKRLLRDISHELRSPLARLNVALGLARGKAGAAAREPLDRIEREAGRLNDLIGELLALNLLESGADHFRTGPVDLQALAAEVVRDADFEAQGSGRAVRLVPGAALWVTGVAELLRRALENVVRNAVRFTAEGTAVEVRCSRVEGAAGESARVAVRDRGPGVPEAALGSLFEPFYRVADARDRKSGGSGLGLAITDRAVRLHGGRVAAANAPDGGLEVVVELPAAGAPAAAAVTVPVPRGSRSAGSLPGPNPR